MPQPRWNAAIFGRLVIPAAQRKAWLAADLDWKSVENNGVLKGYISGESVRDMVDDVNFVEATEFLEITWTGDELRLGSFQSRDGFNESMVGFAAAWAASAAFDGVGELYGLGMGARFGYKISVANGKASVVKFGDGELDEIAKLEQLAGHPDAVALRERMAGMGAAMVAKLEEANKPLPPPVKPAPRPEPVAAAPAPESKPAAKKKAAKKSGKK